LQTPAINYDQTLRVLVRELFQKVSLIIKKFLFLIWQANANEEI